MSAISRRCRRAHGVSPRRASDFRPSPEALEGRALLTLLGQSLFPSDNPWNQAVANVPIAANSAAIMNNIISLAGGDGHFHPDFGQVTGSVPLYGIPYNVVHGNTQPLIHVVIDAYPGQSDIKDAPIPAGAVIEGDQQNGPTVGLANRGDSHLIVYDVDKNIAYEFFNASRPSENADGQWHAAQESVWNLNQDSFRPQDWTSADAAGLPILPGLARPDEALPVSQGGQGVINHALRFTLKNNTILNQYIYPAEHTANPGNTNAATEPPMGTRFRLKASVNIATLDPQSQVIARAMQTYGLILADNGSDFFMSGASYAVDASNHDVLTWNDADIQDRTHGLKSLTFSNFEVVDDTPRVTGLGTTAGAAGSTVMVLGQNFSGAAGHLQVYFGGVAATNVTVVDDAHVTATVPASTGTVDVRVQSGVTTANDPSNVKGTIFGYGISATSAADRFTYTSAPVNHPPVALADSATTPSGTPATVAVLANDSDPDGDPLTVSAVTQPVSGTATINANSTVTYAPKAGFSGKDSFTYTASDGRGGTATATVTITVSPPATAAKWIVNVGDPGYSEYGTYWTYGWGTDSGGYRYRSDSTRTGTWTKPYTATWTVSSLPAGTYQIYTTWVQSQYNASNSPYTVFDGSTTLGAMAVNQQVAAADVSDGGRGWKLLGTFTVSSGTINVQLNDNANGKIIADAIRVVATSSGATAPAFVGVAQVIDANPSPLSPPSVVGKKVSTAGSKSS